MTTQFKVKRLESLLAPSLCSEIFGAMDYFGGAFVGIYTAGLAGYIGLACLL